MRNTLVIGALLAMLSAGASASAQTIDKNGRCHDKGGKAVKMAACKRTIGTAAKTTETDKTAAPVFYPPRPMWLPKPTKQTIGIHAVQ